MRVWRAEAIRQLHLGAMGCKMPIGNSRLMLMIALALPGAARALGLGDIHTQSALNEPLAAEIEIVGATAAELADIRASVANRETFLHFGAERPEFLDTATFKVTRNGRGLPVLAVRSRDAFTDPMVDMLVDLRWHSGQLIRQYTLLLDPSSFPSATPIAEAPPKPAADTAIVPAAQAGAVQDSVARKTIKIGAKATLRGVAWRAGSRSDSDLNRMMIGIFRSNPGAFEGNINRLRLGAVLSIPQPSELASISREEADREVHAQMESWRASTKRGAAPESLASIATKPAAAAAAPPTGTSNDLHGDTRAPGNGAEPLDDTATAALTRRLQLLEERERQLQQLLEDQQNAAAAERSRLALAEMRRSGDDAPSQTPSSPLIESSIAAAGVLAAGTFAFLFAWHHRRRSEPTPTIPAGNLDTRDSDAVGFADSPGLFDSDTVEVPAADQLFVDVRTEAELSAQRLDQQLLIEAQTRERAGLVARILDDIDTASLESSYIVETSDGGPEETVDTNGLDQTVDLPAATVKIPAPDINSETVPLPTVNALLADSEETMLAEKARDEQVKPDAQLMDMDDTVQHVQMPSLLHETVGFKERRTSLVDVLKKAIEREPGRGDLRMKLLETYYTAVATNRQGFLEFVHKIARDRENMPDGEWDRIALMGRQIASDCELFAPSNTRSDEEDLANCA